MSQGLWPLALAAILVSASRLAAGRDHRADRDGPEDRPRAERLDPVAYFTNETPVAGLPEH